MVLVPFTLNTCHKNIVVFDAVKNERLIPPLSPSPDEEKGSQRYLLRKLLVRVDSSISSTRINQLGSAYG